MDSRGLKSNNTKAKFRNHTASVNHLLIGNQLNCTFFNQKFLETIITNLNYVRVDAKWHYVCFIIDLFNCETTGHSCGLNKRCTASEASVSTHQIVIDEGSIISYRLCKRI